MKDSFANGPKKIAHKSIEVFFSLIPNKLNATSTQNKESTSGKPAK